MAEGLNRAILLGNLGADPELRMTNGGTAVLNIRLATSESYLDKNKQRQERTEWHRVIIFGRRAEALGKLLTKGDRILVEGSIRTSSYEGNDGVKKYTTEIVAQNIVLSGGGNRGGSSKPSGMTGGGGFDAADYGSTPDDDDIPFVSSAFLTGGLNGVDRI